MLPNIVRGHSFKGVIDYLMHDKREDGKGILPSSARVGFTHVLNFIGDEARDPFEAGKIMALTVRDKDYLKEAAGVGKGGRKAEKPPVWHTSLAWHPDETIDKAEMMRAVDGCLKAVGLGLDKGYQVVVVQHTDEPQPHLHVVVNLVHPVNGKQANPNNDYEKAQEWGRKYDKARGVIYCHDREEKYAAIDAARAKGATSIIFNDRAQGGPVKPTADQKVSTRPKKGQKRPEWEARQDRQKAAQEAAGRIRAENDARYHAMRSKHDAAYQGRQREFEQSKADQAADRNAIYEEYKTALDAVWKPEAGPKTVSPDMEAWRRFGKHMDERKAKFEQREKSLFGRYLNAWSLLSPSRRGSIIIIHLALNGAQRRKLFDQQQRRYFARNAPARPARPQGRPQPATPELKRVQAERLKAMRTLELAELARKAAAAAASMRARHQFQREGEQAERLAFSRDSKAAWARHGREFPRERSTENLPPAEKADRFGRSRDRKPRAPRQGRGGSNDNTLSEVENRPVDTMNDPAPILLPPFETPEIAQQPPVGVGDSIPMRRRMTPEERTARIEAERVAREAEERDEENRPDSGRTMAP
jgi:hypothetical protein